MVADQRTKRLLLERLSIEAEEARLRMQVTIKNLLVLELPVSEMIISLQKLAELRATCKEHLKALEQDQARTHRTSTD